MSVLREKKSTPFACITSSRTPLSWHKLTIMISETLGSIIIVMTKNKSGRFRNNVETLQFGDLHYIWFLAELKRGMGK